MRETIQEGEDTERGPGCSIRISDTDMELVQRYLSDSLTEEEHTLIETRIVVDPDFRREVELTVAMQEGMRELARRSEIAPLLAPQSSFWTHPPLAVAASIIAGLLATTSLLLYERLDQTERTLMAATNAVRESTLTVPTRIEALRFEQTRGVEDTPDATWRRSPIPTLLELRFDIGLDPAASYTAVIEQAAAGSDATVLVVPAIGIDADGQIMISVHSALLRPADYRIRLEPRQASHAGPQSMSYSLRIVD